MNFYILLNVIVIVASMLYIGIESYIDSKQKKYVMYFLIFIFSIIMAIRPLETKDTQVYVDGFNFFKNGQVYNINFLQKYHGFEIGYIFLIRLFKLVSSNYRIFFFIIAFVGTTLMLNGLKKLSDKVMDDKKSDSYGIVFAVYISNFGFLYNGISVRAGLSMGLGIKALNCLLDKQWIKGLSYLFLAISIQRTSFLFVLIYIIIQFGPIITRKVHVYIWSIIGIMLVSEVGSEVTRIIINLTSSIILKYNISGYGAYLVELYPGVGLRDIYLWLLYGFLIIFAISSEYYGKYLNVIMVGALMILFMHEIRAIARAYDLFYLFIVPTLVSIYSGKTIIKIGIKKIIIFMIMIMNAILMLRLCFI